jgi:hypothetical protein
MLSALCTFHATVPALTKIGDFADTYDSILSYIIQDYNPENFCLLNEKIPTASSFPVEEIMHVNLVGECCFRPTIWELEEKYRNSFDI